MSNRVRRNACVTVRFLTLSRYLDASKDGMSNTSLTDDKFLQLSKVTDWTTMLPLLELKKV